MLVRSVRAVLEPGLELVDRARERARQGRWRGSRGTESVALRDQVPFARDEVLATFQHEVEIEGRPYRYVLYPGHGDTLAVHFSAFFGEWGDRRPNRPQFQGHFHRLRMFWTLSEHAFLFLSDTFGADRNGSYYKGEDNDFFVERAMEQIMASVRARLGIAPAQTVAIGSSMGATAALRFALRDRLAGAVVVSPHIDLDLSGRYQGRARHVAAIVGRKDIESADLYPVTREIRALVDTVDPVPRIVMQSMRDDDGVHEEQVLPFVSAYRARGGWVELDERATGGHTSDHATADWFRGAIERVLTPQPVAPT
jgi:pimeloyl-ACP methyl ester carboxylesterase